MFLRLNCVSSIAGCLLVWTLFAADLRPDDTIESAVAILAKAADTQDNGVTHDRQASIELINDFLIQYADIQGASRIILSERWKITTVDDRVRFTEAFHNHVSKLLIDLVADLDFDTVSMEPFEGDLEELPVKVRLIVRQTAGAVLRVDFLMHDNDGRWKILDVIIEGVSYLRHYRTEFRLEINENGLEQVIERFVQESSL
jgi:phospholipid transport system substrate-binding protein